MNAPNSPRLDFAGIDYADALARAHELVPVLRERATRAEAARGLLPETVADLKRTGLMRIVQPRRWGGMELDFVAIVDFTDVIGRGCASTSWTLANISIHHWMLALYEEQAQEEEQGREGEAARGGGQGQKKEQGRHAAQGGEGAPPPRSVPGQEEGDREGQQGAGAGESQAAGPGEQQPQQGIPAEIIQAQGVP